MRLLNTQSLELEEFFDDRGLRYAILSHRGEDGEVLFQDIQRGIATKKKGYAKIKACCDQALKDGFRYAWIDTCCIDKTSRAELTASINSMFHWYEGSKICYAYLSVVEVDSISENESFGESKWFTRGWTLQELIAPQNVQFYNHAWLKLGDKENLMDELSDFTGIDKLVVKCSRFHPEYFSIGKRMSWAAQRTTTRVEDRPYSLLGLFSVNMPMLYGEGERAFRRLQEEIMKNSDDQSLFAWEIDDESGSGGLLAERPEQFHSCSNIVFSSSKRNRIPYSITNMGLSSVFPLSRSC